MTLTASDVKEKLIEDFKELIQQIDKYSSDEINNRLLDITKRVRKLYLSHRDD